CSLDWRPSIAALFPYTTLFRSKQQRIHGLQRWQGLYQTTGLTGFQGAVLQPQQNGLYGGDAEHAVGQNGQQNMPGKGIAEFWQRCLHVGDGSSQQQQAGDGQQADQQDV